MQLLIFVVRQSHSAFVGSEQETNLLPFSTFAVCRVLVRLFAFFFWVFLRVRFDILILRFDVQIELKSRRVLPPDDTHRFAHMCQI